MSSRAKTSLRSRAAAEVLTYGACSGLLIVLLQMTEYRFLVVARSVEVYAGLIAILFAGLGIRLGMTLARRKRTPASGAFEIDRDRVVELGITPRELEILGLIAAGLSNREIAERLFVSENTVKTHSRRLFEKLGARRRTQAVQMGQAARLIP